jgi:hypothetical protein
MSSLTQFQTKLVFDIVTDIVDDLKGRSGLSDQWDEIDEQTKEEIVAKWRSAVANRLFKQTDTAKALAIAAHAQDDELLVSFGNLSDFTLASLKQIMGDEVDTNHEAMVEEHLKAFNYAVSQGIHPGQALFALVQAFAMLQGFAIRSGLRAEVAGQMMAYVMRKSQLSSRDVQIVVPS